MDFLDELTEAKSENTSVAMHSLMQYYDLCMITPEGEEVVADLCELEIYCDDDPYTHRAPEQVNTTACWYFHRAGKDGTGKFRGGTFKGLDITCGPKGKAGGILIRAIRIGGEVIEGPCTVVDRILKITGMESVKEFTESPNYDSRVEHCGMLYLSEREKCGPFVMSVNSRRVGLRLQTSEEHRILKLRCIRLNALDSIKKDKQRIYLDVVEHTGIKRAAKMLGKTERFLSKYNPSEYEKLQQGKNN